MNIISNREQGYHNKGQADGAHGKYDPPIGTVEAAFGPIIGYDTQAQSAYDKGYDNGRSNPSGSGGGSSSGSSGSSSSK